MESAYVDPWASVKISDVGQNFTEIRIRQNKFISESLKKTKACSWNRLHCTSYSQRILIKMTTSFFTEVLIVLYKVATGNFL